MVAIHTWKGKSSLSVGRKYEGRNGNSFRSRPTAGRVIVAESVLDVFSSMTNITIEIQPTKRDFAHLNFHVLFPRPLRRGAIISLLPLTGLVVSRLRGIPSSTNTVVNCVV